MSFKDWLYIPKSDKIAIICLLVILIITAGALAIISYNKSTKNEINIEQLRPDDYKKWQAQLIRQKEVEKQDAIEKYQKMTPYYQPKMRLGETIELNTADTTILKTIPGIGSGFSNRIVNYRTSLGGYAKIEQLNEVWGLDTYLYSQIVPYMKLEAKHDSIYINKDSFEKLLSHPYLNYKQVQTIIDIRERKGAIKSIKRLELLDEFSKRDIERLSIYTSFKE